MANLIDKIRQWFREQSTQEQRATGAQRLGADNGGGSSFTVDEENVKSFMLLLQETKPGEFTCEETLELLDEYVELVVDEAEAAQVMPLVKEHLEHCPDCRERYETLLVILQD